MCTYVAVWKHKQLYEQYFPTTVLSSPFGFDKTCWILRPLTDQLITYSRALLVKSTGSQLVKKFYIKLLCCLFTYCQFFPNFFNHHIMISISVSSSERLYIEYTRMSSPIYQYVIHLVVSLPIRRGPGVFMNVQYGNIVLLTTRFFDVAKFTIQTPLLTYLLTYSMEQSPS